MRKAARCPSTLPEEADPREKMIIDHTTGGQILDELGRGLRDVSRTAADQCHFDRERHADDVRVERADQAPAVVDDRILRVHHYLLVFPELEPAAIQRR